MEMELKKIKWFKSYSGQQYIMKQQISPWSIYDNWGNKNQSNQIEKQTHNEPVLNYPKSSRTLSPNRKRTPPKYSPDIDLEKNKLNRKINQLLSIQIIKNQLIKQNILQQLPAICKIQQKPAQEKIVQIKSERIHERQQSRGKKNVPHFPKLSKVGKIILEEKERDKDFDDRTIHEKLQMLKQGKKAKFSLKSLDPSLSHQI